MTIDRVRSAVSAEPVRRLIGSAPSADELRSAISGGLDALVESAPSADEMRSAISDGLDTLSSSLGTVAERVDRSAEAVRDHMPMPEQLFRQKRARTGPPRPLLAIAGAAAVLGIGFVLGRVDRSTWTTLRDRAASVVRHTSHRAGAVGRHLANRVRGTAAIGTQAITPTAPVTDDVLEARVKSALGRARGLHVIKIEADAGVVRVEGHVEPGEREPALALLRAVPGVREIDDRLAVDAGNGSPDSMPGGSNGLDGGRTMNERATDPSTPRP